MDDTEGPPRERVEELLERARDRARVGDDAGARELLDAIESVAASDLPTPLADRLAFGCRRVEAHLGDDHAVAAEYIRAMERLLDRKDP